jgi:hypothetical protein
MPLCILYLSEANEIAALIAAVVVLVIVIFQFESRRPDPCMNVRKFAIEICRSLDG